MQSYTLQSGTHIARIDFSVMPDGLFEGRVFVRLSREPEVAETYIPVGLYPTEEEALQAAQERAERALRDREF